MKVEESRIGFIGLGEMGRRLARRLIDRGFRVSVYDRTAKRIEQLVGIGAIAADSVRTIATNSDVIMSCVTNDYAVLEIYAGEHGALSASRPGTIVIEMSTVLPETS